MKSRDETDLIVYVIRSISGDSKREIVAPIDCGDEDVKEKMEINEYIDSCHTYLGYFGKRINFVYP